ncbi:transglycosylase domain-containing protein [Paenibacillus daejeonensis]|uniref:transglycosylase domain-containing protein n=1 Tax=Paenibacillus daejeonensis TaxID=135193 RepID=UPI00035C83F3|nr:penicillin-binding protein 1A [Paenibacillus daejeonensis]
MWKTWKFWRHASKMRSWKFWRIGSMLRTWKFWRNTGIGFGAVLVVFFVAAAIWINGQDIDRLEDPLPEPTLILDVRGEPASQLAATRLIPIALEDMPKALQEAVVAVEDQRFYKHGGIDLNGMARAFMRNAQAGGVVEGASTITQQLAKNLFLNAERTYDRKLKEVALAIKIDRTYSKDKILEMYLNQIYFGEGAWGVQQASRTYFGKDASELTLAESAMLAALPKAPSHYSPFVDREKALKRRNLVLTLMQQQGKITEQEMKQAQNEVLDLNEGSPNELAGQYLSYVNHAISEAEALYGLTEDDLLRGGYRIYTNLDPKVQQAMEDVYTEEELFPASPDETIVQSGAVMLDPQTGGIRGIVGRRGDPVFRGYNYATQLKRQPGSAFKPIAVYAPALEAGYTPYSRLEDKEMDFEGYQPRNADRRTRGAVTLEQAVESSYNIPAVWLLNEVGVSTGLEYIHRLGIPTTDSDRSLSLALGGMNEGVSPLQMASAYSAFANEGKLTTPHAITRIERKDGSVVAEAKVEERQVLGAETAYMMTEMLQGVVDEGTGKKAKLTRPAAGKTGTTQLPDLPEFKGLSGSRDTWFVGYTPELVAAIWMGYDKTDAQHYLTSSGGDFPAQVFQAMMTRALDGEPVQEFTVSEAYAEEQRKARFRATWERKLVEWEHDRFEKQLEREEKAKQREEERRIKAEERREREEQKRLEREQKKLEREQAKKAREQERKEKAEQRERERAERDAEKAREREEREAQKEQDRLEREARDEQKRQDRERLREQLERESGEDVLAGQAPAAG